MDDLFTKPELLAERLRELIRLNNWTDLTEELVDKLGPPPQAKLRPRQFLSIGIYFENEFRTGKLLREAFYTSFPRGTIGFGGYHAVPMFVRDRQDRLRWPRNSLRWIMLDVSSVPSDWPNPEDFDHRDPHFEVFAAMLLHPRWARQVGTGDEPAVAVPSVRILMDGNAHHCLLFGNMPFFGDYRKGETYLELWSCSPYYFMKGDLPYKVALPSITRY